MTIHVAEEGSRRKGDMSPAEVAQSLLDIVSWFKQHAPGRGSFDHRGGATERDVQALEKTVDTSIPEELRSLLSIQDRSDLWFSDKQALTCKAMVATALDMENQDVPGWRTGLVPFAKDDDDNFLVADTHERGCPVKEWDKEGEGHKVAPTFSAFLEHYRDDLLGGRLEFVEGLGIVEKMAPPSISSPPRRRGK